MTRAKLPEQFLAHSRDTKERNSIPLFLLERKAGLEDEKET